MLRTCNQSLCVHCMRDVFSNKWIEKSCDANSDCFGTRVNYDKNSIIQACNFSTGVFLWLIQNFEGYLFWKIPVNGYFENLSGAAILIFRRYFGRSSLPAFYKISVCKTTAKCLGEHICRSLFLIQLQTFSLKFIKLMTASWIL